MAERITGSSLASDVPIAGAAVTAALRLTVAAAMSGWRGADPFDGLWWSWPRMIVGGKRRRQAIVQLHARAPFDIRRIYKRSPSLIPKTLALFASAALRLWQLTRNERHHHLAIDALEKLDRDRSAGEVAWGYPWDLQTRWSFYPAGTPNVVVTAFAAHALRDAADTLGRSDYGVRAQRAAEWVRSALWLPDAEVFAYHPGSTVVVHNANLLAAALVRRLLPRDTAPDLAVSTSLRSQAPDGSWPYGSGAQNVAFVDSFHTGYVLGCLLRFTDRPDVISALERGAGFYASRFFDEEGRASLWPGRRYPEDGHSAGTAMTTLSELSLLGLAERDLLRRVTARVLSHGLQDGRVVHRRGRLYRSPVRYVRWCDAHVALGLSHSAAALAGRSLPPDP